MHQQQRTHALSALLHLPPLHSRENDPSDQAKPLAKKKPKRPVSNSVRCKRYRDQKEQYEGTLVTKIALLRQELATLQRGLSQEKALMLRHVPMGSIDRVIRKYFALFEYGIAFKSPVPEVDACSMGRRRQIQQSNDRIRSQEAFLHHMMDPQVVIGPLKGVQSWITMLRIGSAAFVNVRKLLLSLEVIGSEESPVVVARAVTHSIITRESFQIYFPGVALDNELIHKYMHTPLAIDNTMTFQFTSEGRVEAISMESSFIVGLIKSGWSMADASRALPPVGVPKSLKDQVDLTLSQKNIRDAVPRSTGLLPSYPSRDVLLALVRECCTLFEIRTQDAAPCCQAPVDINAKKGFLHRVLDTNVASEDVVGVDAVVQCWLYMADMMANVRKTITKVSIAGDQDAPILIIQMKNEIPTQWLASMMPKVDFLFNGDAELHFFSKAQFHFSHEARVSFCSFDSGCSEALQEAGMELEETSRVLQWFHSMYKPTVAASPLLQGQLSAITQSAAATFSKESILQSIPPKRAPKSNRERGQVFRIRQNTKHTELQRSIDRLRATVSHLEERANQLHQNGLTSELKTSEATRAV